MTAMVASPPSSPGGVVDGIPSHDSPGPSSPAPAKAMLSWLAYSARREREGEHSDIAVRDPVLAGYIEHLGNALKNLWSEVHDVESRHGVLDRQVAEFGGLLQDMEQRLPSMEGAPEVTPQRLVVDALELAGEEVDKSPSVANDAQVPLGAIVQDPAAAPISKRGEGSAPQTAKEKDFKVCLAGLSAGMAKKLEERCEHHGTWLLELSAEIAALSDKGKEPCSKESDDALSALVARVDALERNQRTLSVATKRALHTALITHQQQLGQEIPEWAQRRLKEQDGRIDKIMKMAVALTDRALLINEGEQLLGSRGLEKDTQALLEEDVPGRRSYLGSRGGDKNGTRRHRRAPMGGSPQEGSRLGNDVAVASNPELPTAQLSQFSAREGAVSSSSLGSPGLQGLARILQEDHASAWEGLSCRSGGSASWGGFHEHAQRLQDDHAARGCEVSTSYGSDGSPGRSPGLSPGLSQALRDRLHQDFDAVASARRSEQANLVLRQARQGADTSSSQGPAIVDAFGFLQSPSQEQRGLHKASASLTDLQESDSLMANGVALRDERHEYASPPYVGTQASAASAATGQFLPASPLRESQATPISPANDGSPGWSGLAQVLADLEEVLPAREET